MIYQRGLCYILAALLVSAVWLAATDRPQNSAMEEYREEYRVVSGTAGRGVHRGKGRLAGAGRPRPSRRPAMPAQSQESYYSGQITEEQYERQIAEVNTVLAHEHGFEAVYQQYLYICENTGNRYFLNTNGWAGLFSAQTLDFLLFLVILILAAAVFARSIAARWMRFCGRRPRAARVPEAKL